MKTKQKKVKLSAEFVALAEGFGMVPELLAERVLKDFTNSRPQKITILGERVV